MEKLQDLLGARHLAHGGARAICWCGPVVLRGRKEPSAVPSPRCRHSRNTSGRNNGSYVAPGDLFQFCASEMDIICALPVLLMEKHSSELIQLFP